MAPGSPASPSSLLLPMACCSSVELVPSSISSMAPLLISPWSLAPAFPLMARSAHRCRHALPRCPPHLNPSSSSCISSPIRSHGGALRTMLTTTASPKPLSSSLGLLDEMPLSARYCPHAMSLARVFVKSSRVVDPCNPDVSASRFAVDLHSPRRNAVNPRPPSMSRLVLCLCDAMRAGGQHMRLTDPARLLLFYLRFSR